MDKVDKVARAIWEVWRTSDIAPSMYHDFPWEDLKELGEKYPAPQAPGRMLKLAMAEAQAALAAMGEREAKPRPHGEDQ